MRYVKVKVFNKDRKRGDSTRQISFLDYDGVTRVIKDGAEVDISEYGYHSLLDAKYIDTLLIKDDPDLPARKEFVTSQRIEITKLGDFYEKGEGVIAEETIATEEAVA
ncbi:MAG: hypothetical protein GY861_20665 [bacterium]|nr:hypothetical protein [bacterium]